MFVTSEDIQDLLEHMCEFAESCGRPDGRSEVHADMNADIHAGIHADIDNELHNGIHPNNSTYTSAADMHNFANTIFYLTCV